MGGAPPAADPELLHRAAKASDDESGLPGEDPGEALELWRGLVEGRWSLVDHFDADGRHYLLARCNDPPRCANCRLTLRERQVVRLVAKGQQNKLVADALGISESAVSTHLSAAMRKLAVHRRTELLALVGALRSAAG